MEDIDFQWQAVDKLLDVILLGADTFHITTIDAIESKNATISIQCYIHSRRKRIDPTSITIEKMLEWKQVLDAYVATSNYTQYIRPYKINLTNEETQENFQYQIREEDMLWIIHDKENFPLPLWKFND